MTPRHLNEATVPAIPRELETQTYIDAVSQFCAVSVGEGFTVQCQEGSHAKSNRSVPAETLPLRLGSPALEGRGGCLDHAGHCAV